tara:strand:+ start:413 stop:541 length:129 start_codon:yes stop_codon:yes gene_type:complete
MKDAGKISFRSNSSLTFKNYRNVIVDPMEPFIRMGIDDFNNF